MKKKIKNKYSGFCFNTMKDHSKLCINAIYLQGNPCGGPCDCRSNRHWGTATHWKSGQKGGNGIYVGMGETLKEMESATVRLGVSE